MGSLGLPVSEYILIFQVTIITNFRELQGREVKMVIRVILERMEIKDIKEILVILELTENK